MEMLFGAGAKIYLLDESQDSPLHTAVRTGDENFVRTLLRVGRCDANTRGHSSGTALHIAADMDKVAICRILVVQLCLDSGAIIRQTKRRVDGPGELITHYADVTVKDVDLRPCVRVAVGHTSTMELLLQKREAYPLVTEKEITGFTPVYYAAKYGHFRNILLFMERNKAATSVTSDEMDTALHGAARYGWKEIVEVVLTGRKTRSTNLKDNQGKTSLQFACAEGHDRVVELLIKLGACVEKVRDHNDRTALHIAAMRGSKRCVQCILQNHPQCINLFDKNQNTALHLTVIHGHTDIVSCLLSYSEQQILMNKKNHNVLDSTIDAERKNVALAIASHNRPYCADAEARDKNARGCNTLYGSVYDKGRKPRYSARGNNKSSYAYA
nr:transient receptor potential cation channel subfamily A member 1-like [Pocillopora verrucosa]